MKSIIAQIDRKTANIMAVAFVGIHVPLVSLILYGIFTSFTGLGTLVLTILIATLFSTVATIYLISKIAGETQPDGVAA